MSKSEAAPRTMEQLEADMEAAFREGDIGLTALRVWEMAACFPENSATARIYGKKILRDPYVAGISLDSFKKNAKELREAEEPEELAKLSALGLLRFPAERYLSLSLMDAAQSLGERSWIRPAVEALGEPADDDVVLLNAVASLENESGNYDKAYRLFEKLRALEPDNETILQNLSASLVGLGQFDDAIEVLEQSLPAADEPTDYVVRLVPLYRMAGMDVEENIAALDARIFAACSSFDNARVHVSLQMFLQSYAGMATGLRAMLDYRWDAPTAFDLAEVELAQNQLSEGLERYGVRFEAFPYLAWLELDAPRYVGQTLGDEVVFVWGEQGIGDEVMFSMFLDELSQRVRHVVVACDLRLHKPLSLRYPDWQFLDRYAMPEILPAMDYACPMGDLMVLFMPEMIRTGHQIRQPILLADSDRLQSFRGLLEGKVKPRIAITWRGGRDVHGKIRSMELQDLLAGLPQDMDVDIISLQYTEGHEQEVIDLGDSRVALSGLNNRLDLEGVFALLRCCDAVVTVDNAVAHFAAAIGIPTAVLIPAAQTQFRWKNEHMKNLLFPTAKLFIQDKPADWTAPVQAAWQYALGVIEASRSEEAS